MVEFRICNLLGDLKGLGSFDPRLLPQVLIYFDQGAQTHRVVGHRPPACPGRLSSAGRIGVDVWRQHRLHPMSRACAGFIAGPATQNAASAAPPAAHPATRRHPIGDSNGLRQNHTPGPHRGRHNTMLRLIRNLLQQLDITNVEDANNGEEALAKLNAGKFGLCISDWNMPTMTGFELLRHVRASDKLRRLPSSWSRRKARPRM